MDKANVCVPWSVGGVSSAHMVDRRVTMGLQFGIFDHIEPVPGLTLSQIYRERVLLLERYDEGMNAIIVGSLDSFEA
jgi:hypothetical protein